MKKPPLPPAPPSNRDRGHDEPQSGRARKDVAYTPSQGIPAAAPASVRSVAPMRASLPLPSQAASQDDYDLLEDLATPTRSPEGASIPTGPMNLSTGPMQPIQAPSQPFQSSAMPMPPPSQRGSGYQQMPPPSQRGSGFQAAAMPYAPPPSQRGPATAPPGYQSSQHLAIPQSVPGQQLTGPMQAIQPPHYSTGSYPTGAGQPPPSSSRTGAEKPDEGVPLGYVVASAFFLAIALVGFGLYLAFEVISL